MYLYLSLLLFFLSCVTMISKDRSYSSLTPHALSAFIMFLHSIIQVVLMVDKVYLDPFLRRSNAKKSEVLMYK